MFRQRKVYGQSKVAACPFCGDKAFSTNAQDVPVCRNHTEERIPEIRCVCGEWLELKIGKWGPFFTCFNCGIVNMTKAMEMLDGRGSHGKRQTPGKKAPPKSKDHAMAAEFEARAKRMEEVKDIPTLDELAEEW